jgi:hypothetical protein
VADTARDLLDSVDTRVEAYVQTILDSRRRANASGQRGEDVASIRAAYLQRVAHAEPVSPANARPKERA